MTETSRDMSSDPRAPCVIGVAQRTVRKDERPSPEPLALWEEVCRGAATDSGAAGDVLAATDSLQITFCQSWPYDNPTQRLADRLGMTAAHQHYSGIGGTTGQVLVQDAARSIIRGDLDVAVVCGAETLATLKDFGAAGETPGWSFRDPVDKPFPWETHDHAHHPGESETVAAAGSAPLAYGPWDIARRAHLGIGPHEYRRQLGEMMAPMTTVAAGNPHAWFRRENTADFLITPRPDNRMVVYPYTKHMVAIMDVDMAAAVIVASHEAADRLGVPRDRRVYLRGWCCADDPAFLAEHDPLWASPAMAAASQEALACAEVGIDDIEYLDLYSCFASALNFARDALGIQDRSGDRLTVTGGLPYAGGPASNYMLHSIAAMSEVLRKDDRAYGMVTGIGLLMVKHVFGVYSVTPPSSPPPLPAQANVQAELGRRPRPEIVQGASGRASLATYSVLHHRSGEPAMGVAICDLPDGRRTYARFDTPDLMAEAERVDLVGERVTLEPAGHASVLRLG